MNDLRTQHARTARTAPHVRTHQIHGATFSTQQKCFLFACALCVRGMVWSIYAHKQTRASARALARRTVLNVNDAERARFLRCGEEATLCVAAAALCVLCAEGTNVRSEAAGSDGLSRGIRFGE